MKKYYDNPYQTEYWKAQRERDKVDNEATYSLIKIGVGFFVLGILFLLLNERVIR